MSRFDRRENRREHVTPVRRMRGVLTRCRRVRSRMDVIERVVVRRVTVPSMVERPRLVFSAFVVLLVVVDREVTVLVPRDLQAGRRDALRIEPRIVRERTPGSSPGASCFNDALCIHTLSLRCKRRERSLHRR